MNRGCKATFQNLKDHLVNTPSLSKPIIGEDLYVYLATNDTPISVALIREDEGIQIPIHLISEHLSRGVLNYSVIEKLDYNLLLIVRKLPPYF